MLRKGCWRLQARLCFLYRSVQVSKSGHRKLVSCIDRKSSPGVQVLETRRGAMVPTPPGALSPSGGPHCHHPLPDCPPGRHPRPCSPCRAVIPRR